jgi:hypothetical protein
LDADDLALQIEQARETNKQLDVLNRRNSLSIEWAQLENDSNSLTQSIADREQSKTDAISNAIMPLDGLSFGDGEVIYNGLPLDQASDAERLRVSVAIAMAGNSQLRVMRIKDGSLLDDDSLQLISDMADDNDWQIWLEKVSTDGNCGVVMENGEVVRGSGSQQLEYREGD